MKKVTLAIFAALSSVTAAYSQALSVMAPPQTNNYYGVFLTGTQETAEYQGIFLITPAELNTFTSNSITGIDVPFLRGAGSAVNGTCEVHLVNTSNTTYALGWPTFSTATSSMTPVYSGPLNINAGSASFTVPLNFSTPFPFTMGGGVYLAIKWKATNPAVLTPTTNTNNYAAFPSNTVTSGTFMGGFTELSQSQVLNGGFTLSDTTDIVYNSSTRPCFLFKGVNTATNEIAVTKLFAMGKVARNLGDPQEVQALVKNNGINAMNNVSVTMNITGVNPFSNIQVVNIPAGQEVVVTFDPYTPTNQGSSNINVSVPSDDNNSNNSMVWTQSVSCNFMANNPPSGAYANSGLALTNSAITDIHFLSFFAPENTQTLTAVRVAIGADADNQGKHVYGVLIDESTLSASAPIQVLAATNIITLTGATNGFQTLKFDDNDIMNGVTELTGGNAYLIGFVQQEGGSWTPGFLNNANYYDGYRDIVLFNAPTTGNASGVNLPNNFTSFLGIEPVLGPAVTLTSLTNSIICRGQSVNLMADGADSYTWSAAPNTPSTGVITSGANQNNLGANLSVIPTPPIIGSAVVAYTYTARGTDAFGCTNSVSIVQRFRAINPDITIAITPPAGTVCTGAPVNLIADGEATSYTWTARLGTSSTNTFVYNDMAILNISHSVTGVYTYTLRGTDIDGCQVANAPTVVQRVEECVGINTISMNNANIMLYPNPSANGKTEIHGLEGKNTIEVYNMLGQQVINTVSNSEVVSIDLTNQPSGNYLVKITNESNQSKVLKFINQH
ncbi:MAG: T9SS type A sorting domain-containing protein [Bacteroidetes bacterium]|nr:T9SS type A sorting domain-containing protein [Bacteroidota bacterium]